MSPSPENPQVASESKVRTFRGSTIEELIPQIRAELGPGAIILRERQGLTGGVGGFFARRCVEIDAQAAPRVSVYADDSEEFDESEGEEIAAEPGLPEREESMDLGELDEDRELDEDEYEAASTPPGFAQRLVAAAEAEPQPTPEPQPATASRPFAAARPAPAPEPVSAPQPAPPSPAFIAFEELGSTTPDFDWADAHGSPVVMSHTPKLEAREIPIPILLQAAPEPVASVFRPRVPAQAPPVAAGGPAPEAAPTPQLTAILEQAPAPAPGPDVDCADELVTRLIERGLSEPLAREIIDRAVAAAGPDAGPGLQAAAQAALAVALRVASPLPSQGAIAVVGSGGSGKTRSVAGLASRLSRAGQPVTVARLGGAEHGLALAELLRGDNVELIPAMRTQAMASAVTSARTRGLVLIDTASTSPGAHAAVEILAETLAPFALDGVLLCAPTTFTARALQRLADSYAGLPIRGLLATHADEGSDIGAVAELSIRSGIPIAYLHAGLDTGTAISTVEPARLAAELLR